MSEITNALNAANSPNYSIDQILQSTTPGKQPGGFRKVLGAVVGGVGNMFAPGLGGLIGQLAAAPGALVEPGVVLGQDRRVGRGGGRQRRQDRQREDERGEGANNRSFHAPPDRPIPAITPPLPGRRGIGPRPRVPRRFAMRFRTRIAATEVCLVFA